MSLRYTELMISFAEAAPLGDFPNDSSAEPVEAGAVPAEAGPAAEEMVNYDEAALVELELDGTDYRLDAGRAGTALCISTRPSGSYRWTFRGEARWQANVLRCKAAPGVPRSSIFDRGVLDRLSRALAEISNASE